MVLRSRFIVIASVVALTLTLAPATAGAADADRERIAELQQQWVQAVAERDVDAIVGFYAEDAWFLPAGSPAMRGRDAIRDYWEKVLAEPPWRKLTFGPEDIRFRQDGDLAIDVGSSRTVVAEDGTETVRKGKYLIVWERRDGEWKVTADAFNANSAAP